MMWNAMEKLGRLLMAFVLCRAACTNSSPSVSNERLVARSFQGGIFGRVVDYAVDLSGNVVNAEYPENLWGELEWSPDGQWVAYETSVVNEIGNKESGIYLQSASLDKAPIRIPGNRRPNGPAWSPDGRRILYHLDTSDGSEINILDVSCVVDDVADCQLQPQAWRLGSFADWAPTGDQIVYQSSLDYAIIVAPLQDDREPVKLSGNLYGCAVPNWSPDGSTIVFSCKFNVYAVKPDGSDLVKIVEGGYSPKWTPTGEQIVILGTEILDPQLGQDFGVFGTTRRTNALFIRLYPK